MPWGARYLSSLNLTPALSTPILSSLGVWRWSSVLRQCRARCLVILFWYVLFHIIVFFACVRTDTVRCWGSSCRLSISLPIARLKRCCSSSFSSPPRCWVRCVCACNVMVCFRMSWSWPQLWVRIDRDRVCMCRRKKNFHPCRHTKRGRCQSLPPMEAQALPWLLKTVFVLMNPNRRLFPGVIRTLLLWRVLS